MNKKSIEEKKIEIKRQIVDSVSVLIGDKEDDIIHDFGSMEKFLEGFSEEINSLKKLYEPNN